MKFVFFLKEYLKIGKLVATHGLKGELLLKHTLGKKSTLRGLQAVFIEEGRDSFIPWFIQKVTVRNDAEVYLTLESVESKEAAQKLVQKEVWVPEADFKKFSSKSSPVNLLGYSVVDQKNLLGDILEIIEQPHQILCRLEIDQKEVLVPLNENTLKKIDHKKKRVIVDLPEGLLDIYLG
jgi:16S rRNA processing protein RimM